MKRIILFFAVCLGLSVHQTTLADNSDLVRAASKRDSSANVSTTNNQSNRTMASSARKTDSNLQNKNARTAVKATQPNVVQRTQTNRQNVKTRTAVTPTKSTQQNVVQRVQPTTSRSAVANRKTIEPRKSTPISATSVRSATKPTHKTMARAATTTVLNAEKISEIKSKDYSKCKTVYYECMDEFCANKDTDLRRCACSSRIHEFDDIKKQLSNAEDKMLDFNQRLLTVALDKEDAAAINVATEGEKAYNTKDRSESEKLLKKITDALNDSGDSKINNNLSSISLSLDVDTAWDDVDSMSGIATTAKSGLDLYKAARPVCVEMAHEVCSEDELDIVQNSYKLTIEQDCNTVAKSYDTMYNKAMEKIHESSALLDMSRLNLYQQNNSDDTLACKKKILEQLNDSTVCGANLYKCLDTTGQYIDPSTGEAFLSTELYNLTSLLQYPAEDQKWAKVDNNESFVNFLNSKKEFLEPAIEQCQDIADMVWQDFLEDALAKIKLAQNAKLEEIRKNCSILVSDCKNKTLEDLSDFDSRALSTFQVAADATVNSMCSEIQNSCTALLNEIGGGTVWSEGMQGIASDITYDNIMETCKTVGRDCIVRQCNGTSGNFALCQDFNSDPRRAILNKTACWDEVLDCVKSADNVANIKVESRKKYYQSNYSGIDVSEIPNDCDTLSGAELNACLIAEQIWGNCEHEPSQPLPYTKNNVTITTNKILIPNSGSTLLSWFASNTGVSDKQDSCLASFCQSNYKLDPNTGKCVKLLNEQLEDGCYAESQDQIIHITRTVRNKCASGVTDMFGNCCMSGYADSGICVSEADQHANFIQKANCPVTYDDNDEDISCETACTGEVSCKQKCLYYCPKQTKGTPARELSLYCISNQNVFIKDNNNVYKCTNSNEDGFRWILVDQYGNYFDIDQNVSGFFMGYNDSKSCNYNNIEHNYEYDKTDKKWKFNGGTLPAENVPAVPTDNEFLIKM